MGKIQSHYNLGIPLELREQIDQYILAHPGTSIRQLIIQALSEKMATGRSGSETPDLAPGDVLTGDNYGETVIRGGR